MPGLPILRIGTLLILTVSIVPGTLAAQDGSDDVTPSLDVPPIRAGSRSGRTATVDPASEACPPIAVSPVAPILNSPRVDPPFVPYMLGDFIGPLANPMTDIKVGVGESPRPLDRVFYRFNFYSNLEPSHFQDVSTPYKRVNLFLNTFGFEKTFGEWFSLGFRMPINSIQALSRGTYYVQNPIPGGPAIPRPAPPTYNSTIFGNMNGIVKFKLVEDLNQGYMISGGASLSFPTASNQTIDPGPSTASILQPFLGYIVTRDRFFLQGFSSFTLPLVTVQSMIMFQDIGFGFWAYRSDSPSAFFTGFAPTFEAHLNVPLQGPQRAAWVFEQAGLPFNTQFNLTFGGTFEFWHRATLGMGLVVPTVGPIPFDCEFLAQLNVRF
ncbi:hypothetical protein [Aquisphaera insulae]|uniref:hypothetical protein n=1 Tax=Aquisphaera insulae TaxID=2712864 RepID=UPI0013ED05B6|nr:hypothetical protein [Aquisphaera insulae]